MKHYMKKGLALSLMAMVLATAFVSCEVEFSPNAEWKNVPVVYCVLDQDDDTTWVRVERCYQSEGNVLSDGSNPDSIYYPEGAVAVSLLAYENGSLKDSMAFEYMLRERQPGNFAAGMQPVFAFPTGGGLKENYTYVLTVRNTSDNSVLATTDPISLIQQTESTLLRKPYEQRGFGFYDIQGSSASNCEIEWNALQNARLYQPIIRFYYGVEGEARYVDVRCNRVAAAPSKTIVSTFIARSVFLEDLKLLLQKDTAGRKEYLKRVDIFVTACTEDLNEYMSTAASGSLLDQDFVVYNNIHGGVGIFAARRTHLFKRLKSDDSELADGLYKYLKELGVGLYLP